MKIIYVHGLDSSAQSVKGKQLAKYCAKYHPEVEVVRPDLNMSPQAVFDTLCELVRQDTEQADTGQADTERQNINQGKRAALVGSSLGGYFATLVSNETGCRAVLLNPSTQPHVSLQRFIDEHIVDTSTVLYETSGGWQMTMDDLHWFNQHLLNSVNFANEVYAIIKSGDELLDPYIAKQFYERHDVDVAFQEGGNHRMSDFVAQIPQVMQHLLSPT